MIVQIVQNTVKMLCRIAMPQAVPAIPASSPSTDENRRPFSVPAPADCPSKPPMPPSTPSASKPPLAESDRTQRACQEFLTLLREELGNKGELRWQIACANYRKLTPERGWPELSNAALARELKSAGCSITDRRHREHRHGQYRVLFWPCEVEARFRAVQLNLPLGIDHRSKAAGQPKHRPERTRHGSIWGDSAQIPSRRFPD